MVACHRPPRTPFCSCPPQDVLLSADELALVLDDTEAVWPGHRRNLLQVRKARGPWGRPAGQDVRDSAVVRSQTLLSSGRSAGLALVLCHHARSLAWPSSRLSCVVGRVGPPDASAGADGVNFYGRG